MKLKINLFGEVLLDLGFRRDDDGTLTFTKAFGNFLGRPLHPHLSLFASEILRPHFTAANDLPEEYRRYLPAVKSADVAPVVDRVTNELLREWVKTLRPTDLRTLEAEGWTVHGPNVRVLQRWARLGLKRHRGELRVDLESVCAFVHHVVRHPHPPTALEALLRLSPDRSLRPLIMRWNRRTRRPEVRMLSYFPDGCGVSDADGQPTLAHPPGWYVHRFDRFAHKTLARIVPRKKMEDIVLPIVEDLARYPRRTPFRDEDVPEIPSWVIHVASYFVDPVFYAAVAAVLEHVDSKSCRQPPQPTPGTQTAPRSRRRRGGA